MSVVGADDQDVTHAAPVWAERADFVIGAPIVDSHRAEQLRVRQLGDVRFQICCVPFFLYDLALGDVVETDSNYTVVRVIERSGRLVFRVWFGESFHPRQRIADELVDLGALVEWSSSNLLAVDAADERVASGITAYLANQEKLGALMYETGRT